MRRAVFFERDGVLNEVRLGPKDRKISPMTLEEFRVKGDAVGAALQKLKTAGFILIATTNQPGLSRGYQSRRELDRMHEVLRRQLPLDDIVVCPHDETDHCPCRAPRPGLLIELAFKWHLSLEHSFVVSDRWEDAEASRTAGPISVMIDSPCLGSVNRGDFTVKTLDAAVDKILAIKNSWAVEP